MWRSVANYHDTALQFCDVLSKQALVITVAGLESAGPIEKSAHPSIRGMRSLLAQALHFPGGIFRSVIAISYRSYEQRSPT